MNIQVDSREKARAIKKIVAEFDRQGINYFISKLYVGDYMNFDNPRLIVDRKQNLSEICANVCQNHDRFRNEIIRANEHDIKLIFLIEHGKGIERLEDVIWWNNPRSEKRVQDSRGNYHTVKTKAMQGSVLYKVLCTMKRKYNCDFMFCSKEETGAKIVEILGGQQ